MRDGLGWAVELDQDTDHATATIGCEGTRTAQERQSDGGETRPPIRCVEPYCDKVVYDSNTMSTHKRRCHNRLEQLPAGRRFYCPVKNCTGTYQVEGYFGRHIRECHSRSCPTLLSEFAFWRTRPSRKKEKTPWASPSRASPDN
eukprot:GHVU01001162.1.p1 GENE.GHVU01001162.1~~GHVU01001162.1.p1  ORF type:complete len:144 (-),score=3.91 GHVU01001162.1:10-441(-)